jgi:hypothetical protein
MGEACSANGGDKNYIQNFKKKLLRRDHLGDLHVYGRIILK